MDSLFKFYGSIKYLIDKSIYFFLFPTHLSIIKPSLLIIKKVGRVTLEKCKKSKQKIDATDHIIKDGDEYVHATCPDIKIDTTKEVNRSYKGTDHAKPHFVDQKEEFRRDSKGSAITEVDISWSNAFWLAF